MKYLFTLFIAILLAVKSNAQHLKVEKDLETAVTKAKAANKLLMIIAYLPTSKTPENLVTMVKGEVADFCNSNFITYTVSRKDPAFSDLYKKYQVNISSFPTYLFVSSSGRVVYSDKGWSANGERMLQIAKNAVTEQTSGGLTEFAKMYVNGKRDSAFLRDYIIKRKKYGITDNTNLIEDFARSLKVSSLNDYQTVLFILESAPIIDGVAYKLAYLNRPIIDSIYRTETVTKRSAINNGIINSSFRKAIEDKNKSLAYRVASYTQSTWSKQDPIAAYKRYQLKMLQFYEATKDTLNYLQNALVYYDRYFGNLTADSLKRLDSIAKIKMLPRSNDSLKNLYLKALAEHPKESVISYTKIVAINTPTAELNHAAWKTYLLISSDLKNRIFNERALKWSKKTLEVDPNNFAYYDTYAHLLYRSGNRQEAEINQKKAIELASNFKQLPKTELEKFRTELAKMQSGTL